MKKHMKLIAAIMAATMVLGSGLTVLAAGNEQSTTGSGSYEGSVDKSSAFSVDVPTAAANQFDFFVDPNGLLEATDYARIGGGVSGNDFEDGATLYFTRTVSGGDDGYSKKYGKDSDSIKLTNMSSYAVDVEVSATITGATGITLSEAADVSTAEAPTLYLAIVSGSTTGAITSDGGKVTGSIAGEPNNFEIKYEGGEYKFAEKANVDASTWKTVSFNLTGACGGTWTDKEAEVAPVISLTWKVTDPKAGPADVAPSITKLEYDYDRTSGDLVIPVSLGKGELAATDIALIGASGNPNSFNPADRNTYWTYANGNVTLKSNMFGGASVGDKRWVKIRFNDAASTDVVITLNITK